MAVDTLPPMRHPSRAEQSGANLQSLLDRPDLVCDRAYIGGTWHAAEARLEVIDPARGTVLATVPNLGEADARRAIDAAADAFPGWVALGSHQRSAILRKWFNLVLAHREDLAVIMTAEQGKPLAEALSEVDYAASYLEWFAEEAKRVDGEILSSPQANRRLSVLRQPVGVVAAITPWNFPLAMVTRKAAPALAVGCTMVLKPSELTPLSALALARLGEEAGLPVGVFNVVTGDAPPIGAALTGDPRVRKFSFTGSTATGKRLAARCMETVKRVSLELGGNAPFIVFDDADLAAAVEGAIASKFRNAGQTCVCANRLLVQTNIYERFAARLAERVASLRVGPGSDPGVDQGPLIDSRAVAKALQHCEDAVARGARVLVGGQPRAGEGFFFPPTVLADVPSDALLCREETFGPVAGIVRFDTEADAIVLANDTTAGLASYVFTSDQERAWRVAEALQYGMVGINTGLISTEVAPFGGIKESGFGREGSRHGLSDYLELKYVNAPAPRAI